jgi:hypothetical protein
MARTFGRAVISGWVVADAPGWAARFWMISNALRA